MKGVNSSRRDFVRRSVAGAGAMTLVAGCLGGDNGDDDGTDDAPAAGEFEDYPEQPIDFIIPFSQGGGTDTFARQFIPILSDEIDEAIEIRNVEGAGSLRGTGEAYYEDPDGYTVVAFNPPSTPTTYLMNQDDVDWDMTEFEGVCSYSSTQFTLCADPDSGIETLADLEEYYRDEGGNIAGAGEGSAYHLLAFLMGNMGFEWEQYVSYDGAGPVAQAVAEHEVVAGISADLAMEDTVSQGNVNAVTTFYSGGSPIYPDMESITDQGYENVDFLGRSIRGVFAPPGTPEEPRQIIADAVEVALEDEDMIEWSEDTGNPLEFGTGEEIMETLTDILETVPQEVDLDEIEEED